jgi:hypothetical protein
MGLFSRLLGRNKPQPPLEDAVIITIPPTGDDDRGLNEFEDPLIEAIERAGFGEFDGNEINLQTGEARLYMYGPDGERLFSVIEPTLRKLSFPSGTTVRIRTGGNERAIPL